MKKVLAISGGGIRGILPARFVQALEAALGKPARDVFDMIAGNSTGGIIATGLYAGVAAKDLGDFYIQRGPSIFPGSVLQKLRLVDEPIYDAAPLERALKDVLGNAWLSEPACHAELLVPSYCVSIPKCFYFKSWKCRPKTAADAAADAQDFLLRDIARCTSAAPLYFPRAVVKNMAGEQFEMVDGGVFANDPSLIAAANAGVLWPGEDLLVVSVGTGDRTEPIDLGNGGAVDVALAIADVFMDASADLAADLTPLWPRTRRERFEIALSTPVGAGGAAGPASTDMADASTANLARLELLAEALIAQSDMNALAAALQAA